MQQYNILWWKKFE